MTNPSTKGYTCQAYTEEDYDTLFRWWTMHGWTPPEPKFLPKNGLVVHFEGEALCAGFIYKTDSKICWMEWIVADPVSDNHVRSEGLDILLRELNSLAGNEGYQAVFTSSDTPAVVERYKKAGFAVTDTGVSQMLRRIS